MITVFFFSFPFRNMATKTRNVESDRIKVIGEEEVVAEDASSAPSCFFCGSHGVQNVCPHCGLVAFCSEVNLQKNVGVLFVGNNDFGWLNYAELSVNKLYSTRFLSKKRK